MYRKDTTSETETNNNNNKTNDDQTKANDNSILGPSDHSLEQQKAAAEVECWEKERMEESESRRQLKRLAKRMKATEERVQIAEEDSKARGAVDLVQSTLAFRKPPKRLIQSKLASK